MKTMVSILGLLLASSLACSAKLQFDTTSVELKAKPADEKLDTRFTFKNTGKETVKVTEIDLGCSCLLAETDKKSYAPGESGRVDVVFKLGSFTGHQRKGLTIVAGEQRTRLQVGVQIPNVITITPDIAEWFVGEEPAAKTFKILVEHPDPIKITGVVCRRQEFSFELKTVKEGREYEIALTPDSTEKGMLGMLQISTDCKIPKHQKQMAFYAISRRKPGDAAAGDPGEEK